MGSIPPLLKIRGKSFRGSGIFATHVSNQALFPFEAVQEKGITERKPIKTASGAEMFFFLFWEKLKKLKGKEIRKTRFPSPLSLFFPRSHRRRFLLPHPSLFPPERERRRGIPSSSWAIPRTEEEEEERARRRRRPTAEGGKDFLPPSGFSFQVREVLPNSKKRGERGNGNGAKNDT